MNEREATLTDKFDVTGHWWLPSSPDQKACGRLAFDPHGDATVELDGRLEGKSKGLRGHKAWPIVLGETRNGVLCTLAIVEERATSIGPRIQTSVVSAAFCLLGCHFDNLDAIQFMSCEADYSNLTPWLGRRPFDEELPSEINSTRFSVAYKDLPNIRIPVKSQGFSLTFGSWFRTGGGTRFEIEMKHGESVVLRPRSKRSLRWFLERLYELRHLLTLLMMEPSRLERIRVQFGKHLEPTTRKMRGDFATVLFRQTYDECEIQEMHEFRIPFHFSAINKQMPKILENWFGNYDLLQTVYGLFLLPMYNQHLNIEYRFLSYLQALEALHRLSVGGSYMTIEEYDKTRKAMDASIPSGIENDHTQALKSKIKYGYEYSLRKRLKDLAGIIGRSGMYRITDGEDPEKFLRRVVETRNYLTHHDQNSKSISMSGKDMVKANHSLRLFLMLLILQEICIPVDLALERLDESGLLRYPVLLDRDGLP
jgi:hypothetical protein